MEPYNVALIIDTSFLLTDEVLFQGKFKLKRIGSSEERTFERSSGREYTYYDYERPIICSIYRTKEIKDEIGKLIEDSDEKKRLKGKKARGKLASILNDADQHGFFVARQTLGYYMGEDGELPDVEIYEKPPMGPDSDADKSIIKAVHYLKEKNDLVLVATEDGGIMQELNQIRLKEEVAVYSVKNSEDFIEKMKIGVLKYNWQYIKNNIYISNYNTYNRNYFELDTTDNFGYRPLIPPKIPTYYVKCIGFFGNKEKKMVFFDMNDVNHNDIIAYG